MRKVIVNDPECFYNGREATIENIVMLGDMAVYWVSIPSGTGNATIEFALRDEKVIHMEQAQ